MIKHLVGIAVTSVAMGLCPSLMAQVPKEPGPPAVFREVGLPEVLRRASDISPDVASSRLRAVAAESRIGVEKANFYPTVSLQAVETTGFAASTGNLGMYGITGSPFRVGPTAGVAVTVPIWDFGRTLNAVDAAEHDAQSEHERTEYIRYSVYQTALKAFYDCAMQRDLSESWTDLAKDAKLVRDSVIDFVRTGQRSIVEKYLADSQYEQAVTQATVYDERLKEAVKRLGLITGLKPETITCPILPHPQKALAIFHGPGRTNPSITQAMQEADAARARLAEAKSDYLPKLVGAVNVGAMSDTRFVQDNYYSAGVAVILPVFEGFKTNNQVAEASALLSSAEKRIEARKLAVADLDVKYDLAIRGAKAAYEHLLDENELAEKGFKTAKQRFISLQGSVVDVRMAFDNLTRTEVDLINAQEVYLEASGAKAILNGMQF